MINQDTAELWKGELKRIANSLEQRYRCWEFSVQTEFEVEKEIFLGFYSVRKLKESNHLSQLISEIVVDIIEYPPYSDVNFEDIFKEKWTKAYDFFKGKKSNITLSNICNQFIHSKIYAPFVPFEDSDLGMMGIYFASDHKYKSGVYYIQLVKVVELLLSAAEGSPVQLILNVSQKPITTQRYED